MYAAPTIDSSGIHVNTYLDILAYLKTSYQSIFGADVYLGNDSQDYQWISIVALAAADANAALQLAYNNFRPQTAIGAGQDSLYKLNGMTRKTPSYSTCDVVVTGTAGTVIAAGVVQDPSGSKWDLPALTIPGGGSITVTAICETIGDITALIGNLTQIVTPVSGWTSVTNLVAATAGQPVETDAQYRARQAISTSLPSETLLAGTVAAIAALAGVTRYSVLENSTNITDSDGLISHSIWAIVEGANVADIAQVIYDNKGPGCGTNGDVSESIVDPISGLTSTIKLSRPIYVKTYVALNVHLLTGGTSATLTAIHDALVDYLNSLQIGETITISALIAAAMSVTANLSLPTFSVSALTAGVKGAATLGTITPGSGYTAATGLTTSGGTGTGCTVDITVSGGGINGVTIRNAGSGYTASDVLVIHQGSNVTGAVVAATITTSGTTDITLAVDRVALGQSANVSVASI